MGFIMHRNEKGGVLLVLVNIQDDMIELQKLGLLDKLLVDKTTRRHILWGTNAYRERGERYANDCEIFVTLVLFNNLGVIKTRARKAFEQQVGRTKLHGEVATPLWVCNKMIDAIDCEWFGIEHLPKDVWQRIDTLFQQTKKSWKKYVDNKRLEIACGEAPYLIQRYDGTNGMMISIEERTGILDRKLHVVSAYATTQEEWIHWAIRAVEATFGYEYQGDNLLIARVNVIKTFIEFYTYKWNEIPHIKLLNQLITKITWNLWQMDGLTGAIPCYMDSIEETSLFDELITTVTQPLCKVYDWRNMKKSILFSAMKGRQTGMKFNYVIGNPPYQKDTENNNRQAPIYNEFMDEAEKVADVVELITPARFLFNAGQTAKEWNNKKMNDEHFKVVLYEPNAAKIFPNTDIKGGVAITIRNAKVNYGAIQVFTAYSEMTTVLKKVRSTGKNKIKFDSIVSSRGSYRFTPDFFNEIPTAAARLGKGNGNMIGSDIFQRIPEAFSEHAIKKEVQILGRINNERKLEYIKKSYVIDNGFLYTYNVILSKASGRGAFGEVLGNPKIVAPGVGTTDTFLSIGQFGTEDEAKALLKYVKTKFLRALLSVKKITQNMTKSVWSLIPMQNFTSNSDIDWSQSISNIDQQLYKKYKLTQEEIDFIETNVKEMK